MNNNKNKKKQKQNGVRRIIIACIGVLGLAVLAVAMLRVGSAIERRTYKLNYKDFIVEYSTEYDLDPYLIAAIIHCESGNRPAVKSPKGAIGLMQIMPDTGEWIAGKLDIPVFTETMLEDPAQNIRMGCWYLNFLEERFHGDQVCVLAAYNAGHNRVQQWLEDSTISENGTLAHIPFQETEQYVKKVQRAYEKYKKLYRDEFSD